MEFDTSAAVAAFLDLATADLRAHGQVATHAEVARRIGVKAADLSQARTGGRPASVERLIRWVSLWNGRPFLGGIADYRSDTEIVVEASSATGITVRSRATAEAALEALEAKIPGAFSPARDGDGIQGDLTAEQAESYNNLRLPSGWEETGAWPGPGGGIQVRLDRR